MKTYHKTFLNLCPHRLPEELMLAQSLGILPVYIGEPGYDNIIQAGKIKWVVTEDGTLFIAPYSLPLPYSAARAAEYRTQEISHVALSLGLPVISAGEAVLTLDAGQCVLQEINNHSGHYEPDVRSIQVGIRAFKANGVSTQLVRIELIREEM